MCDVSYGIYCMRLSAQWCTWAACARNTCFQRFQISCTHALYCCTACSADSDSGLSQDILAIECPALIHVDCPHVDGAYCCSPAALHQGNVKCASILLCPPAFLRQYALFACMRRKISCPEIMCFIGDVTRTSLGAPNIKFVSWAPQNDVLGHPAVKAFITHAGSNSIHEAGYHGKPVICIPMLADQFDQAARVRNQDCCMLTCHLALGACPLGTGCFRCVPEKECAVLTYARQ